MISVCKISDVTGNWWWSYWYESCCY